MASYKVPQDVEADDKLLGPFSFRQFLYLIVVALAGAAAWGLGQLFIGLAIIPLPVILLFGALALPLRKDQPMEIYLAALVSFYLKPRMRKWDPDGVESTVTISAPKTVEVQRTKGFGGTEAQQRLSYLADIVDTQGWAIRGLDGANTPFNNDMYLEAQSATDILDANTSVAQNFGHMMAESTERMREEARQRMFAAPEPAPAPVPIATPAQMATPAPTPMQAPVAMQQAPMSPLIQQIQQMQASQQPQAPGSAYNYAPPAVQVATPAPTAAQAPAAMPISAPQPAADPAVIPRFDPYPEFHQSVLQPLDERHHADSEIEEPAVAPVPVPAPKPAPKEESIPSTSDNDLKAGIMNLANNPDLSIETIAHQADRLKKKAEKKKKEDDGDVIVSLR